MCGICGEATRAGRTIDSILLESMTASLRHRGPDALSVWTDGNVGFGHTRLSIIDRAHGHQPLANEDGSIHVTFNGEIYNHAEVRRELEEKGHVFRTRCDTEVLVHLYEERGPDLVDALNGFFAFAIHDRPRNQLILARDRAGIKPLYYHLSDERITFASELKALLRDERIDRRLSHEALLHYFTWSQIPAPFTIHAEIKKLPPAHVLIWREGETLLRRYWHLPDPDEEPIDLPPEEERREIRSLLAESVRARLMSEVPLGAFLSGGIDSSLICHLAQEAAGGGLKTFCVRFAGAPSDESEHARRVAAVLGTEHETLDVDPGSATHEIPEILRQFDEPFADTSALPTYFLCREARRHVTVCLSGDGGDELFGGYRRHMGCHEAVLRRGAPPLVRDALHRLGTRFPGSRWLRRLHDRALPGPQRYLERTSGIDSIRRGLLPGPALGDTDAGGVAGPALEEFLHDEAEKVREAMLRADFHLFLPDFVLTKVDRMSMAHALEVRVPFLDHRVIERAFRMPLARRVTRKRSKIVLRDMLADVLPADLVERPKAGFGLPLGFWFREGFDDFAREVLAGGAAVAAGLVNPACLERLLNDPRGIRRNGQMAWNLMALEIWLEERS